MWRIKNMVRHSQNCLTRPLKFDQNLIKASCSGQTNPKLSDHAGNPDIARFVGCF